jgi:hypothetical protein
MVLGRGKQVISQNEKAVIDIVTNNWFTHPHTDYLFFDNPDIVQVYQYPVYFLLDGVWCKGLIDKIDINVVERTITIFDFKTMTGFTLNFPRVIRGRRYDFQLSFYHRGLCQGLKELSDFIGLDVTSYIVKNPVCIVESTNNPGLPMQFELSDSLLVIGQRGDDRLSGYEQILEEYQYWYSHEFDIQTACLRAETMGRLTVDSQFNLIKP